MYTTIDRNCPCMSRINMSISTLEHNSDYQKERKRKIYAPKVDAFFEIVSERRRKKNLRNFCGKNKKACRHEIRHYHRVARVE